MTLEEHTEYLNKAKLAKAEFDKMRREREEAKADAERAFGLATDAEFELTQARLLR